MLVTNPSSIFRLPAEKNRHFIYGQETVLHQHAVMIGRQGSSGTSGSLLFPYPPLCQDHTPIAIPRTKPSGKTLLESVLPSYLRYSPQSVQQHVAKVQEDQSKVFTESYYTLGQKRKERGENRRGELGCQRPSTLPLSSTHARLLCICFPFLVQGVVGAEAGTSPGEGCHNLDHNCGHQMGQPWQRWLDKPQQASEKTVC